MVATDPTVRVPGSSPATSVKKLDKTDTPLHQPARRQTETRKGLRRSLVKTVKAFSFCGFVIETNDFRDRGLHPESEFIRTDSGTQLLIIRIVNSRQGVQFPQQAEFAALFLGKNLARGWRNKGKRPPLSDVETYPRILWSQVVRTIRPLATATITRRYPQDDIIGQVLVH